MHATGTQGCEDDGDGEELERFHDGDPLGERRFAMPRGVSTKCRWRESPSTVLLLIYGAVLRMDAGALKVFHLVKFFTRQYRSTTSGLTNKISALASETAITDVSALLAHMTRALGSKSDGARLVSAEALRAPEDAKNKCHL